MNFQEEKILFRAIQVEDVESIYAFLNDKSASIGIGLEHSNHSSSATDQKQLSKRKKKYIYHCLTIRQSNLLIGLIGFNIDANHRSVELGGWLRRQYWTTHYANECADKIMHYCFNELGASLINFNCSEDDLEGIAAIDKLGFSGKIICKQHKQGKDSLESFISYSILREVFATK